MKIILNTIAILYILFIVIETGVSLYINRGREKEEKKKWIYPKWFQRVMHRNEHEKGVQ
ncbi:hypothetical protein [Bacillus sp. JJ722]|uniref:hypothetical protein n=1 Tax=Bacillus sp. JJ722 TaxID=3122973 RepID=UPI002FFF3CE5